MCQLPSSAKDCQANLFPNQTHPKTQCPAPLTCEQFPGPAAALVLPYAPADAMTDMRREGWRLVAAVTPSDCRPLQSAAATDWSLLLLHGGMPET
jgi:hypothetical protein